MNIKETKALYNGEFSAVEVYKFNGKRHSIHTDFIEEVDGCNDEAEVQTHQLMDEEEYNSTIFANCSNKFTDIYEKTDKVLVIVIK